MTDKFHVKELPNGMTLLGERMKGVSSAAMTILIPAGASHDPDDLAGAASVIAEWSLRGAGDRDTRRLNDALDSLGCRHSETAHSEHVHLAASQMSANLPAVLEIYADIIRRPQFTPEAFESCRSLIAQDLQVLEDEPGRKCNMLLRERFYPHPLGRSVYGTAETLAAMTAEKVRDHAEKSFTPHGTILAVAGDINWDEFADQAERHFGDWSAPPPAPVETKPQPPSTHHIHKDSAQVHIGLAHEAPVISDEQYYPARVAQTVLSGGMSSRLFTEVREKRGLVYHVSTKYHSLKQHAGMLTYAATVPDKTQETFRVTADELQRLGEGVRAEELDRAKTQLKSALVMQGESSSARADAIAGDWYHLGRLRPLEEITEAVQNVSAGQVTAFTEKHPAENFTILTIGPRKVEAQDA